MAKQSAVDLAKFIDKGVRVKLAGGREVSGVLKGYDQLLNIVLDEAVEYLRGRWACVHACKHAVVIACMHLQTQKILCE